MADPILGQSGIYQIRNIANGKVYVGSAAKFSRRFNDHKRKLNNGRHHSIKLQNAWNKNGAESFVF